MKYFTITTNKRTAEGIKQQSNWNEKMGQETSWVLGEIYHNDGWSSVQIRVRDGHTIKPEELFFLGLNVGIMSPKLDFNNENHGSRI